MATAHHETAAPPPAVQVDVHLGPEDLARALEADVRAGLTASPIVLRGYYSQTFRPEHHNFGAEYIFEPRLEPGMGADILAELEAANIQFLYLAQGDSSIEAWVLGLDGILRPLE